MTEVKPVDFKLIIIEIEAVGITPYKLSLMLNKKIDKVLRWKNGQEPKHHEGEELRMIHAEYVPRGITPKNGPT